MQETGRHSHSKFILQKIWRWLMLQISQHQYFLFQTQSMLTGAFSACLTISGLGYSIWTRAARPVCIPARGRVKPGFIISRENTHPSYWMGILPHGQGECALRNKLHVGCFLQHSWNFPVSSWTPGHPWIQKCRQQLLFAVSHFYSSILFYFPEFRVHDLKHNSCSIGVVNQLT